MIMEITVDQMYAIENKGHDMGFLKKFMMENAGAAAVRRLIQKVGTVENKRILIFAGVGNNGGDGLVMARHLAGYNAQVTVCLLGESADKIKTKESSWNWSILKNTCSSVTLVVGTSSSSSNNNNNTKTQLEFDFKPDVVIDAILGTGISGDIREPYASAICYINELGPNTCTKFAVDVPSGLDPQTGKTANVVTKCDMTVTFHKMKQGIPKRPDLTGDLYVEKIGIPVDAEKGIITP